jgi:hypothetical protein
MLNEKVRGRLIQITLDGNQLVSAFDHLVGVAAEAGSPEAVMVLGYSGKDDDLKPGEFVGEITLVVRQVPSRME